MVSITISLNERMYDKLRNHEKLNGLKGVSQAAQKMIEKGFAYEEMQLAKELAREAVRNEKKKN